MTVNLLLIITLFYVIINISTHIYIMATIPSKDTYFIQANRTNSLIDKDNPDQNSSWTTSLGTNGGFNLMPGDVVFVDSVSLDVLGAEDSDSTLSFNERNSKRGRNALLR